MNVNYAIAIIGIVILLAKVADSQDFFFSVICCLIVACMWNMMSQ